jgi:hypothetical protein
MVSQRIYTRRRPGLHSRGRIRREKYEEIKDVFSTFDKRADWVFGIAGLAISGVIIFSKETGVNLLWWIPSIAFLALGMLSAMRVRMPGAYASTMDVRSLIELVE